MLAHLLALDLARWETWTAPVVGLGSAGLLLLLTTTFTRRRKPTPEVRPPEPVPARVQDPFETGSTAERRSAVRRVGKIIKVLVSDAKGQAEPITGWVCDRSLGGLRLALPREFEPNLILSVRPLEVATDTGWVQVEVKRCEARQGHWEIGCQFVRTPPYSQLLLFG